MTIPAKPPEEAAGARLGAEAPVRTLPRPPDRLREARLGAERAVLEYAAMVVEGRWWVGACAVAALLLALAYLFVAPPVYQARSLVQVEQRKKGLASLDELANVLGEKPPADAEIEILRSRLVVGSVVDQLGLDLEARPRRLPVLGSALARRHRGAGPASPFPFMTRFGWGGERLAIQRLDLSADLLGETLRLTALDGGRFRLDDGDGEPLLEGTVGRTASAAGGGRRAELFVEALAARPGTQFHLVKRLREDVIDALLLELRVVEKAKRSGLLVIELEGEDPAQVAAIVNAFATTYLRQNVEQRSAEAAKTLAFLESQLPILKRSVDTAETALNDFRLRRGSVDMTVETRSMLDRERELEKQISELELRRSQLRQSFTEHHPNLASIASQLAQIRAEHASLVGRMRSLPQAEVESARLAREAKDATDLYVSVLGKAQELRVVKSGTVGDVRIIDPAHVPLRPARPKPAFVLMLAVMLGLVGGVAAAIMRRTLVKRASSAEEIEAATGVPVYVTIPHSDAQVGLSRARSKAAGGRLPFLATADPGDGAVETLRSLRTSLQFALVEARNNIVALTGPSPGVGKSFIALNLAHVLATAGRSVLLVDCDLRRGRLHRHFGIARRPGVCDVVSGAVPIEQALHALEGGPLWLLPSGRIPPNPAELLSSHAFEALLEQVAARFDLVIADTPPLLAVSDAMLVARWAGVNFLVLRADMHTDHEIALAVKQFALNGIRLHGSVLNDVRTTLGGRYGRGGYIRYEYASDPSD